MARYYNGKRIDAEPGFKDYPLYNALNSPQPETMKLGQSFCGYKESGGSLEIKGAANIKGSGIGFGVSFGLLKLPTNDYVLNQKLSIVSGFAAGATGRIADVITTKVTNGEIEFSLMTDTTTTTSSFNSGSILFDLFFTKQ